MGKFHHVFSNQVMHILENPPTLSGIFTRNEIFIQNEQLTITLGLPVLASGVR